MTAGDYVGAKACGERALTLEGCKELCGLLLENVAAHRQILAAYHGMQPAPDHD